jgi:uncharacterized membrane protein YphA (DoxX/SURF4 family)
MKVIIISLRIILGLIFTAFSLAYFFNLMPQQPMRGATEVFLSGIVASGYIMPLVKSLELVCGIALLSGKLVSLALIVIFPIVLNIFLFHAFLEPGGMIMSIVLLAGNLFLAYAYRDQYQGFLKWR